MESGSTSSYKVIIRLGRELPDSYKNMVFSKWLRSLRFGNDYFKLIDSDTYYKNYHYYIQSILLRKYSLVRLAVLSDDEDVVLGFSISEAQTLHFVYTHKDNRRSGIATSLIPFDIKVITHLTKTGMSFWNQKCPKAIFNPFQQEFTL